MLLGKTAPEGWQNTLYNDGEFSDWEIESENQHVGYQNDELENMKMEGDEDLLSDDNSIDDEMQTHIRNMQLNNKVFD